MQFFRKTRSPHPALLFSLAVALSGLGPARAPAEYIDSVFNATDALKLQELAAPRLSPDGRSIAYCVRGSAAEGRQEAADLWLVAAEGRAPPRHLAELAARYAESAWSPDGRQLAFVQRVHGAPQIFILALEGDEAPVQATEVSAGAFRPRWSPDGQTLAFSEVEGMGPALPASLDPSQLSLADGSPLERRAWLAHRAALGQPFVAGPGQKRRARIGLIPINGPHAAKFLTPAGLSDHDPEWLPDSLHLICTRGDELVVCDVDGATTGSFTWAGHVLCAPTPSPDGRFIACLASGGSPAAGAELGVALFAVDGGGPPRLLDEKLDRSADPPAWSQDSRFLYFTAPSNGGVPLYRVALTGSPAPERLTGFDTGVEAFAVGAEHIAYVRSRVTNPSELYVADLALKGSRVLTEHNTLWVEGKLVSAPDHRVLTRSETLKEDAWLMKPANFEGFKYPLIVILAGGPRHMAGPGTSATWFALQYFAARSYGLLTCNPRGSIGYGRAYAESGNEADAAVDDVQAALDLALKEDWIDPNRVVLLADASSGAIATRLLSKNSQLKAAVLPRDGATASTKIPRLILENADDPATAPLTERVTYGGTAPSAGNDAANEVDRLVRIDDFFQRALPAPPPIPQPKE